jgi:chemotaxis protein CheX
MKKKASEGPVTLRLPAILDLNAAAPLREKLIAMRGADVEVDASAVTRLGALCLQVLLSARQSFESDSTAFSVTDASSDFVNALGQMGFGPDLMPAKGNP